MDINSVDSEVLLTDYSMVFQDVVLFDDTVMENIRLGRYGATEEEVRALLKNAPIVLLDEATASLGVENETKVQEALSRLLTGKTVLVIAHRMRTVEAADKIIVFQEGKVAEDGSPKELLKKENGIFRRMTQLQSASAGWSI